LGKKTWKAKMVRIIYSLPNTSALSSPGLVERAKNDPRINKEDETE